MAALLIEAAIAWMMGLQAGECFECLPRLLQKALADRGHVKNVAVFGNFRAECLRGEEGLLMLACLHQAAYAQDFRFDR
jgi:hypothetical protein